MSLPTACLFHEPGLAPEVRAHVQALVEAKLGPMEWSFQEEPGTIGTRLSVAMPASP